MTEQLETLVTFSFDKNGKVALTFDDDVCEALGGVEAPTHGVLVGRTLRWVAGKPSSGKAASIGTQGPSASCKFRVQKFVDGLSGLQMGMTWLPAKIVTHGPVTWVEFEIPSNLDVENDPDGLPTDPDFIIKDLQERIANARDHGLALEVTLDQVKTVVEKVSL